MTIKKQFSKITLAAILGIALVFTFSCSSNDDESRGNDISFDVNPQVYNAHWDYSENNSVFYIDDAYTGSGVIETSSSISHSSEFATLWKGFPVGNVTNGIVKLELPENIHSEYLEDVFTDEEQRSCTSYPKDIKTFGGLYILTNSNREYRGELIMRYQDEKIREEISYLYLSKAGKIACDFGNKTYNINAQTGWNKIYLHGDFATRIREYSTNNILKKELKWVLLMED